MQSEEAIRFLRQFQELLAEGGFVATYKFALLQALADLSVEEPAAPDGSLRLHVEKLADKLIEYYWNQARPFRSEVLRQNTSGQAEIITLVSAYQQINAGRRSHPNTPGPEWQKLRARVATVIIRMPLWRLQTIGNQTNEFLYRRSDYENRSILLLPGVPDAFRAFHPLLTSMIRGGWIEQLHKIKRNSDLLGPVAELETFLFGTDRRSLESYRELLKNHQAGECFYCGKKVAGAGDLDHFVPWSRYPVDLGHNFVYAHKSCNNAKRDHLAATIHIERWRAQNLDGGESLGKQFSDAGLPHDLARSQLIAHWAYQQAEASKSQLWTRRRQYEACDHRWSSLLGTSNMNQSRSI